MSAGRAENRQSANRTKNAPSAATINYHNNSTENVDSATTTISIPPNTEATVNDRTWINSFNYLNICMSNGLLDILYRIIDIILLFVGLTSNNPKCSASNRLSIVSIFLLIFYFIDLLIIFLLYLRNRSGNPALLTEEDLAKRLLYGRIFRGIFGFLKLILICIGTAFSFSPSSSSTECELMRFCLGTVCLSTWLFISVQPKPPQLPPRLSFRLELITTIIVLIPNVIYLGTVGAAVAAVQNASCIYNGVEDFYLAAPLKSYGFVGLILIGCTTALQIVYFIISQLCLRSMQGRRMHIRYFGLQYLLIYLSGIVITYYFAIGGMFLFESRSGGQCRTDASTLYTTLIVWEWIRLLTPLLFIPLLFLICCCLCCLGALLTCLPPSIVNIILRFIQSWAPIQTTELYANPPATQDNIEALPVILFKSESDPYSQTDCVICKTDFEDAEPLTKLRCGHYYHRECIANWLKLTRICPTCRKYI